MGIKLTYTPSQPTGKKKDIKIIIQRPVYSGIRQVEGNSVVVGKLKMSSGGFVLLTDDSIEDWVAGSLGQELLAVGYSVGYVTTLPDTVDNAVVININNLEGTFDYIDKFFSVVHFCRGQFDADVSIIKHGKVIKKFNIKNEKNIPERPGVVFFWYCGNESLPLVLQDSLQKLVPTLVSVFDEDQ